MKKTDKPKDEHAQAMAKKRWDKIGKKKRSDYGKMMVDARIAKKALKNKGEVIPPLDLTLN